MALSDAIFTRALQMLVESRIDFNAYPFMRLIYNLDKTTNMMIAGNMRHVLPDLADKCESDDPFSFKLFPANSLNDEESVNYFKANNKVQFKEDFFDLHVTLPFEVVIYTKEERWEVGRTGFVHIGTNANMVHTREEKGDFLKLSKVKIAIKNLKFYDP